MSPTLKRMMSDLRLLSLKEQWQLLSHLVSQLRSEVAEVEQPQFETSPNKNTADADAILRATQGCWGNASTEEIDVSLNQLSQALLSYEKVLQEKGPILSIR